MTFWAMGGAGGAGRGGGSFILQSSYVADLGGLETLRRIGSNSFSDALIIAAIGARLQACNMSCGGNDASAACN